jgi:hypothetical protein
MAERAMAILASGRDVEQPTTISIRCGLIRRTTTR